MQTYRLTPATLSALGTPLAGDTLFGQLCWTLRHQLGNDADCPAGGLHPRPALCRGVRCAAARPPALAQPSSSAWQAGRAATWSFKEKTLVALIQLARAALPKWRQLAQADSALGATLERAQPHNSINRQTGTTGTGMFAPYTMGQTWLAPGSQFDVYVALDSARLSVAQLQAALTYIGQHSYGRDASIGLGKFALVGEATPATWEPPSRLVRQRSAHAGLRATRTQVCPVRSHWHRSVTRFGRHGDVAVQSGTPFKRPVFRWPKRPACSG